MRYEADGCENFVRVALCNIPAQRAIRFSGAGCVPLRGEGRSRLRRPGEEDNAGGRAAQPVDRVGVGGSLLDKAQQCVFQEAAAGKCGKPAGFVDDQEMGVFKQDFEVPRGNWFDPAGSVPHKGLT